MRNILKKILVLSLTVILMIGSISMALPSAHAGEVPAWVKNNAGWWAEGLISDSAFISALEWLIDHGIVVVNLPQNVDPYDITFAPMLLNVAQQDLRYVTTTFFHVFGDLDSVQVIDGVKQTFSVNVASSILPDDIIEIEQSFF